MQETRKPYVRPVVTHLEFVSDSKVTMMQGCKTSGNTTGAVPDSCAAVGHGGGSPCIDPLS